MNNRFVTVGALLWINSLVFAQQELSAGGDLAGGVAGSMDFVIGGSLGADESPVLMPLEVYQFSSGVVTPYSKYAFDKNGIHLEVDSLRAEKYSVFSPSGQRVQDGLVQNGFVNVDSWVLPKGSYTVVVYSQELLIQKFQIKVR